MAQDGADGIPLSYNREQHLVRLLELPPDLLELIEASSAPRLAFKSALPPLDTRVTKLNTSNAPASHVVLTANDKTYNLRQVQTSNSVLLLQASNNGLTVTAQCTSALELEDIPTPKPDDTVVSVSAAQHLAAALPLYTTPADLDDSSSAASAASRSATFADIALSDAELDTAWTLLVAFETRSGHAWRPSDAALVDLWRAVVGAATLHGVPLDAEIHASTLWDVVDTEHPRELFDALLRRLSPASLQRSLHDGTAKGQETFTLDAKTVAVWVCRLCRDDEPNLGAEVQQRKWVARCHELLPEAWQTHVSLDAVQAVESVPASASAAAAALLGTELTAGKQADKASAAEKRGAAGPQRDWHARFKKAKQ